MIYGIMHTALFALGLLPLGMTRGLWRDLAIAFPGIRSWIPVDDMSYFHKVGWCVGRECDCWISVLPNQGRPE
jgi:hypothetical protein